MAASFPDRESWPVSATPEQILALQPFGEDSFHSVGGAQNTIRNHIGSIFGGHLLAQSLLAATYSVADMPISSLHAYFLVAGKSDQPIDYHVTRLRDSRRFANRQVSAFQQGQMIFTLMCEFHVPEEGFVHQHVVAPAVLPPEAAMPLQQFVRENRSRIHPAAIDNFGGPTPIEVRLIEPEKQLLERSYRPRIFWFRVPGAERVADPRLQQCLAAYSSDYWFAGVSAAQHMFPSNNPDLLISSLDHAMWFHHPARCDQWLLHHTCSPSAGHGLGLAQGQIFDRQGRLVATTTQECLLRRLSPGGHRPA